MEQIAKAVRHEWRGELLIMYGRRDDGTEVVIGLPAPAVAMLVATKPPVEEKGMWTLATAVPALFFEVGTMPIEADAPVTLKVHTALAPFLFSYSPAEALSLSDALKKTASKSGSNLRPGVVNTNADGR